MPQKSDWEALSPKDFEALCTELIENMGFQNVRGVGGSSDRGRDILCERDFQYSPGLSDRFRWVIQCKHYPHGLRKNEVVEDLAAARAHRCDIWWLLTSAKVSPGMADWLQEISRNDYPFKVGFLDRDVLVRVMRRFPDLLARYLPAAANAEDVFLAQAIEEMALGRYQSASEVLIRHDDGSNPRVAYLLACCFSMRAQAEESRAGASALVESAFAELERSAELGLLDYFYRKNTWGRNKSLELIHNDRELSFIRRSFKARFIVIFEKPEEFIGCFMGGAGVLVTAGRTEEICSLSPGRSVVSAMTRSITMKSTVVSVHETSADCFLNVNSELMLTRRQALQAGVFWTAAEDLAIGDVVLTLGGPQLVYSVEYVLVSRCPVYSLTLEGPPHFYVEGYLTHNAKF